VSVTIGVAVASDAVRAVAVKDGIVKWALLGAGEVIDEIRGVSAAKRLVAAHNRWRSVKKLAAAQSALRHTIGKDVAQSEALELGGQAASGDGFSLVPAILAAIPVVSQIAGGKEVQKICWHPGEK